MKYDYGEIYIIGPCNYKCYYCISNEMNKLCENALKYKEQYFREWNNFDKFLEELRKNNAKKVYISSTNAEPLLYKYFDELVDYLVNEGFDVGLRTNGVFLDKHFNTVKKLKTGVSISLGSFNKETNKLITKSSILPKWDDILDYFEKENLKLRVTMVILKENYLEIPEILEKLKKYKCIKYLQLRKRYFYYDENKIDDIYYENAINYIKNNCNKIGSFKESDIYDYDGLSISIWNTVFKKESLTTLNYFSDGVMSNNNILVEVYEKKK